MIRLSLVPRQGEAPHIPLRAVVRVLVMVTLVVATAVVGFSGPAAASKPPTTTVLVPSNDATVSGTQVVLDASASSKTTHVKFVLNGGTEANAVIATASPTLYGWIALWNSTTVPNGTYTLNSLASAKRVSAPSTAITITVNNPPSTTVLIPSSGSTVDTTQTFVFHAVASPGATQVLIEVTDPGVFQTTLMATSTTSGWIAVLAGNACPPNAPGPCDYRTDPGTVVSVASYANGVSAQSPTVDVTFFVFVGVGP